jgi:two-component system chemotaxis response regulator CheB
LGAIEVVAKPTIDLTVGLAEMGRDLIDKVKAAAQARLRPRGTAPAAPTASSSAHHSRTAIAAEPKDRSSALAKTTHQVLAIASSTGGTEALKVLLAGMPPDLPGTVIVQHMPPVFTKSYAETLNRMLPFEVKEAAEGDRVLPGRVLLAPGNFHMELVRNGAYYYVTLHQQPQIHGVRPAADLLMHSVAKHAGKNAIGVVLTGMGKDGAAGLLSMKTAGAYNIAQDEASCVVFGMPKMAIEAGAIHKVAPLDEIATQIMRRITAA